MSYSKKERAEYNVRRERISKELGLDKNKYNALRRVGQELHRISEDSAMGSKDWRHSRSPSQHYSEKEERKDVGKAFSKAEALRKKIGGKKKIHFYHQTDPRGASLYVGKKRMSQMDYDREGHAIY